MLSLLVQIQCLSSLWSLTARILRQIIPLTNQAAMFNNMENLLEKVVSLCKRRGFIFPGSEIYGGIGGFYDFGPLGAELKYNIKQEWWKSVVKDREDVVGLNAAIIMNP